MADERIDEVLEELAPPVPAGAGWDDVVRRARSMRRRRRRRLTALVSVVAALLVVASLAAADQIRSLLPHSNEPHLVVRGVLERPNHSRVGTLEIELPRAMIVPGRRITVLPRAVPGAQPALGGSLFRGRWFLRLEKRSGGSADGTADLRRDGRTLTRLCDRCGSRASGRIGLSLANASALVNGELAAVLVSGGDERSAIARLRLVRASLRLGLMCAKSGTGRLRCTRMYTGR